MRMLSRTKGTIVAAVLAANPRLLLATPRLPLLVCAPPFARDRLAAEG
jgi:hypothetical protein